MAANNQPIPNNQLHRQQPNQQQARPEQYGLLDAGRSPVVFGSLFEERAFQLSLRIAGGVGAFDELSLARFPVLDFLELPHLGIYGPDYSPTPPYLTVEAPLIDRHAQLPVSVRNALGGVPSERLQVVVVFHSWVSLGPQLAARAALEAQPSDNNHIRLPEAPLTEEERKWAARMGVNLEDDDDDDEEEEEQRREAERRKEASQTINLMFHCWIWPDFDMFSELREARRAQLDCGVFDADGCKPITAIHQQDNAAPFNRLEKREVYLHDSSFSPNNNGFLLDPEVAAVASFFSLGRTDVKPKWMLTLHAVATSEAEDDKLQEIVANSGTLREVIEAIRARGTFSHLRLAAKMLALLAL